MTDNDTNPKVTQKKVTASTCGNWRVTNEQCIDEEIDIKLNNSILGSADDLTDLKNLERALSLYIEKVQS